MMERARGPEAPCVAAGGGDAALLEPENAERRAGDARVCDRDPPRSVVGRRARGGDVSAEIDDPARHRGPGDTHRRERARGGKALADAAEVDGGTALDPGAPSGELDLGAGLPAGGGACRTLCELLEAAVVAGGDEGGQDRRVEPARGLRPEAEGYAKGALEPVVDLDPLPAGCVQA